VWKRAVCIMIAGHKKTGSIGRFLGSELVATLVGDMWCPRETRKIYMFCGLELIHELRDTGRDTGALLLAPIEVAPLVPLSTV
jgi:hypothetical protein